eukprot:3453706-Prymnesium_polylepis.1
MHHDGRLEFECITTGGTLTCGVPSALRQAALRRHPHTRTGVPSALRQASCEFKWHLVARRPVAQVVVALERCRDALGRSKPKRGHLRP